MHCIEEHSAMHTLTERMHGFTLYVCTQVIHLYAGWTLSINYIVFRPPQPLMYIYCTWSNFHLCRCYWQGRNSFTRYLHSGESHTHTYTSYTLQPVVNFTTNNEAIIIMNMYSDIKSWQVCSAVAINTLTLVTVLLCGLMIVWQPRATNSSSVWQRGAGDKLVEVLAKWRNTSCVCTGWDI